MFDVMRSSPSGDAAWHSCKRCWHGMGRHHPCILGQESHQGRRWTFNTGQQHQPGAWLLSRMNKLHKPCSRVC